MALLRRNRLYERLGYRRLDEHDGDDLIFMLDK